MTIYVAGTFNHLHEGHKLLLARCAYLAKKHNTTLDVGIMSDEYLRNKYPRAKPEHLQSVRQRKMGIKIYLMMVFDIPEKNIRFNTLESSDAFPNRDLEGDILVVSAESAGRAAELVAAHHSDILLAVVPIVRDKKGHKLSSRDVLPLEEQIKNFKEELMWFGEEQWYDGGMYCYHYKGKSYSFDEYEDVKEEDGKPL